MSLSISHADAARNGLGTQEGAEEAHGDLSIHRKENVAIAIEAPIAACKEHLSARVTVSVDVLPVVYLHAHSLTKTNRLTPRLLFCLAALVVSPSVIDFHEEAGDNGWPNLSKIKGVLKVKTPPSRSLVKTTTSAM